MENKDRYEITQHFMYGEWLYETESIRITVCLHQTRTSYYSKYDKKNEKETDRSEFELHGHWFDIWFTSFSHPRHFFIEYANEDTLIFGETESATIGVFKWKFTFRRIK